MVIPWTNEAGIFSCQGGQPMGGREALEQRQIGQPVARQSFLAAGALEAGAEVEYPLVY